MSLGNRRADNVKSRSSTQDLPTTQVATTSRGEMDATGTTKRAGKRIAAST
jgi:hypothetical protein